MFPLAASRKVVIMARLFQRAYVESNLIRNLITDIDLTKRVDKRRSKKCKLTKGRKNAVVTQQYSSLDIKCILLMLKEAGVNKTLALLKSKLAAAV